MSIDFDNIEGMSVDEMISLLDQKRRTAEIKREEIKKLSSAIKSIETNKTEISEEVLDIDFNDDIVEDNFEEEVEYYISEFFALKKYDKDSIIDVLPSPNNYDYERIVLRIIAELTHDIKDLKEIVITDSSNMSINDLKEYKDEIISSYNKVSILKEILFAEEKTEEKEDKKNKLIFVPIKGSEKIRVFEELKDVPDEECEGFIELLESIKNGTFKNIRRFVNNESLNGALEVKGYQVRILFQRLSKDCYAIISMFIKKQQNDSGYRKSLKLKYIEYKDMEKSLKESIKDPDFMKKQQEYEEELFKRLGNDKGGVK